MKKSAKKRKKVSSSPKKAILSSYEVCGIWEGRGEGSKGLCNFSNLSEDRYDGIEAVESRKVNLQPGRIVDVIFGKNQKIT